MKKHPSAVPVPLKFHILPQFRLSLHLKFPIFDLRWPVLPISDFPVPSPITGLCGPSPAPSPAQAATLLPALGTAGVPRPARAGVASPPPAAFPRPPVFSASASLPFLIATPPPQTPTTGVPQFPPRPTAAPSARGAQSSLGPAGPANGSR